MALEPGSVLGPYEIESPLGAGGMGEVYRARDTRLGRIVAVKVLPEHLSQNPDMRARFEREARAASSLNHSHICAVYDVGHQDGTDFLVMEFLEGETLASRLQKGALPVEETLRYARQIADALDRAHQSGLVHRDLKPSNIMLTPAGAKVLDFGLAKLRGVTGGPDSLTAAPTATSPLTAAGTILGTFQYMAPEQLEGKEADARSDIFAFGAVVYEMVTGRPAFLGPTQASLIASILKEEPQPASAILPAIPRGLDRLLQTCLAKDPAKRRQSMRDVLVDLEWLAEGGAPSEPEKQTPAQKRERLVWLVTVVALTAAVVALALLRPTDETPRQAIQATLLPPDGGTYESSDPVALSPDGRQLAFVANVGGERLLWVRDLGTGEMRSLPGTRDAQYPFWSPDGRWLAFIAGTNLSKVNVAGGPPIPICDADTGRGGTWGPDGTILFQPHFSEPLYRVASGGGEPEQVTSLDESRFEIAHRWPEFLPDGRHFLFFVVSTTNPVASEYAGVYVGSLDSPETRQILRVESRASYSEGHLIFRRGNAFMAQPFDLERRELSGDPLPISDDIRGGVFSWGGANFGVSQNASLVFLTGGTQGETELRWVDRKGIRLGTLGEPTTYWNPRISPDGQFVAVSQGRDAGDIWLHDLQRDVRTRFSFHQSDEGNPIWSPDGKRVAFYSSRQGVWQLSVRDTSGTGSEEVLFESKSQMLLTDWSSDGGLIVFTGLSGDTGWDVWVYSFDDGSARAVIGEQHNELEARLSPDGRWIAYVSNESGEREVYVQAFPEPRGRWMVSTRGGGNPLWSRDGKELFFVSSDGRLMAVGVNAGDAFKTSQPEPLFAVSLKGSLGSSFDVSPDGQRFLLNAQAETDTSNLGATLILNWPEVLQR